MVAKIDSPLVCILLRSAPYFSRVRPRRGVVSTAAGRFVIAAKLAFVISQFYDKENRDIKEKEGPAGNRQGHAGRGAPAARPHGGT
jgi:hypothetical protein